MPERARTFSSEEQDLFFKPSSPHSKCDGRIYRVRCPHVEKETADGVRRHPGKRQPDHESRYHQAASLAKNAPQHIALRWMVLYRRINFSSR
jgi:hypothetical protein